MLGFPHTHTATDLAPLPWPWSGGASHFEGNNNFLFPSVSPFYPSSCSTPDEICHTKSCNPNIHKEGQRCRNLKFGLLAASFPEEAEEFVLKNFAQLSPLLQLYNGKRLILPAQLAAQRLAASLCPEKNQIPPSAHSKGLLSSVLKICALRDTTVCFRKQNNYPGPVIE